MRLLNEYIQTRKIKGVPIDFKIQEYVGEDEYGTEADYGDYEDTIAAFKSGELFLGLIRVKASALGLEGDDWLGACGLHAVVFGDDSKLKVDVAETINDHGMVDNAIQDCIENILEQAALLAPIMGK